MKKSRFTDEQIAFALRQAEGIHLGSAPFSGTYGPMVEALAVLWLICYYLYRKRIFIRI